MTRLLEATLLALGLVFTVGATLGIAISAVANGSIVLGIGSVALAMGTAIYTKSVRDYMGGN